MPKLPSGVEGFNVDLANEIAKRMKRPITIDAVQFSGLIPALNAGTYQFIATPVTVTQERAENLLFTEGYMATDFQFVTKKETPEIQSLEELKGKVVGVNKGTTLDLWARPLSDKIGWTVESLGTTTDLIQAVLTNRAYTLVTNSSAAAWAVKNNPAIKLTYLHKTGSVFAIPVRKDNVEMRNQVEMAIECMKTDGYVAKLYERWFGVAPPAGSAAVTVYPGYGVPGMPGYDPTPHQLRCG
jgi:polar amino acid transport system substrate-binding protein